MKNRRLGELIGLLLLVFATLLFLSLVSYHPTDLSLDSASAAARPHNLVGPVGAYAADILFQLFGLASLLLPVTLALWGFGWIRGQAVTSDLKWRLTGVTLSVLSCAALLAELPRHLRWRSAVPIEGTAGTILAGWITAAFNPIGGFVVALALGIVGIYLSTSFSVLVATDWLVRMLDRVTAPLQGPLRRLGEWRQRRAQVRREKTEAAAARIAERKAARRQAEIPEPKFIPARDRKPQFEDAATAARRALAGEAMSAGRGGTAAAREADEMAAGDTVPASVRMRQRLEEEAEGAGAEAMEDVVVTPMVERGVPVKLPRTRIAGSYRMPSPSLLHEAEESERVDEDELRRLAATLRAKCEEFDVRGQVTQINPGPVVTTFEYKPEAGIKYNRITSLGDDLCLALEAESVYIERIPGKSTVGIEVPNRRRETIALREIVEAEEFHASRSCLTMALGKDVNGHIVTTDLAAMPHLLIAGSTGSGKSVALNCMITSLLYKATPDQLRFILVDPKRLELGVYDGIPHLYTPIITEPKQAANALRNATREMERRLKLLASKGVRNIAQYNKLFEGRTPGLFDAPDGDDEGPLPYIVIIIDELADLMIVDASNVEESITRLAQMARAVGIHLILATQRPSVDVITGLIKANFPARMSFRVATKIDSRTILDSGGAEALLGKGDMLLLPPGTSRMKRIHGALVTEKEISAVVDFWGKQAKPEFDESFLKPPPEDVAVIEMAGEGAAEGAEGGENDPLFEDAVRVVLEYGKASTSLLQRRLRIGYGRAAHLIDLMYADGIVGPADGPKPRELLKRPEWLREVDEALR